MLQAGDPGVELVDNSVHPPQLCRPAVGLVHHHEPVLRLVRLHVHLQVGLQGKGRIAQKAAVAVAIMVPTLVRRQALLLRVVIVANVTVELGRLPFAATTAAVAAAVAAPSARVLPAVQGPSLRLGFPVVLLLGVGHLGRPLVLHPQQQLGEDAMALSCPLQWFLSWWSVSVLWCL